VQDFVCTIASLAYLKITADFGEYLLQIFIACPLLFEADIFFAACRIEETPAESCLFIDKCYKQGVPQVWHICPVALENKQTD
jgi:hypothetical protein